ncbi:MAG TPA: hypothetical protein VGT03_00900 [Candidatus Acidoferrales bacterium]|nr:hypothetical protein [Candidatus Acidoferrales bacterium]
MNQRVKSLWIPGLAMLTLSVFTSLVNGFLLTDMLSRDFQISHSVSLSIDGPWLLTLPLIGALGAFWSRRMGGSFARQLAVCQFPVTATFMIFFVLLPAAFLLDSGMRVLSLSSLESYALSWVVIPSLALLVGALPAALLARKRLEPSQAAIRQ